MSSGLTAASLKEPLTPHSVRWLMQQAQAAEIAQRLRELRDSSRETNRTIAAYAGVAERTVAGWASPKNPMGLTFGHAEKVAELFGCDVDWFWRGREKGATPELDGSISEQLAEIQEGVAKLLEMAGLDAASQAADELPPAKPQPRSQTSQARASNAKPRQAAKRQAGSQ